MTRNRLPGEVGLVFTSAIDQFSIMLSSIQDSIVMLLSVSLISRAATLGIRFLDVGKVYLLPGLQGHIGLLPVALARLATIGLFALALHVQRRD